MNGGDGGGGGGEGGWRKVIAQRRVVTIAAKSLKQLDIKHCGDVCTVQCSPTYAGYKYFQYALCRTHKMFFGALIALLNS